MSGAKNCPETPRQKMIGMMYLVLTAMLALNVSAEILNGFTRLRHSMEAADKATTERTADVLMNFEQAYSKDEGSMQKYGDWWVIAQAVHAKSDEFYSYIEEFKMDIVKMVDGPEVTEMPAKLKGGSDTNKPHQYSDERDPNTGRTHGEEMKYRMEEFRTYMTSADSKCVVDKIARDSKFAHDWELKKVMFGSIFSTEDVVSEEGEHVDWVASVFHEMPADAVVAMLTKYQNDIRVAENDLVAFLFAQGGSSTFVANKAEALVIPVNGEYIMQGGHYRAKIVSAMVDTNALPRFYINGREYTDGYYDVVASGVGEQKFTGYMLLPDDTTHYPLKGQYTVGTPSATISNTEMNVMYAGYENKYSISVPGVSSNKIRVEVSGGSKKEQNGLLVVTPASGVKEVKMEVYAEIDGKQQSMGTQVYKVKALPKAQTFLTVSGTDYSEKIPRSALLNADGRITAGYGQDATLDLNYTVTDFTLVLPSGKQIPTTGNRFTKAQMDELKKLKQGNLVSLFYVKATMPNGNKVNVGSLTLILN